MFKTNREGDQNSGPRIDNTKNGRKGHKPWLYKAPYPLAYLGTLSPPPILVNLQDCPSLPHTLRQNERVGPNFQLPPPNK